jgi:GTP-binding protein
MQITSAEFITSAAKPSQYPLADLPEIAFAGRSNVGKSSLINTLLHRKRLVKTSATPGRTRLINFFDINHKFRFVDLPGYGYAKVPSSIQKKWGPMIETYISTRPTLKGVVWIMDIRRTPGPDELDLMDWFNHYRIAFQMVLTKSDKFSKNKHTYQRDRIAQALYVKPMDIILFSARSGSGRQDLWRAILALLDPD